jgi:hypothetical protein
MARAIPRLPAAQPLAEEEVSGEGGEDRAGDREQAGDIGGDIALRGHDAHPAARHAEEGDQSQPRQSARARRGGWPSRHASPPSRPRRTLAARRVRRRSMSATRNSRKGDP